MDKSFTIPCLESKEKECEFYSGSDEECVDYSDDDDEICNYPSADSPKLQFRKDKCIACWIEEFGMAEVTEKKGKLWTTTGITRAGKTYFSLEEIIFLSEIGALDVLSVDGTVLELSDIYGKLSQGRNGCQVSWESVDVYRHLKSLGYIVGRHVVPWSSKNSDAKLGDVENGTNGDKISIVEMFGNLHFGESRPIYDVYPPNSKFKKSAPGSPLFTLFLVRGQPPTNQEIKRLEAGYSGRPLKFCTVDHGRVSFLSYTKVELPVLP